MKPTNWLPVLSFLLLCCLCSGVSCFECHYSCRECINQNYHKCQKCQDGKTLYTVPNLIGNISTGMCLSPPSLSPNALGIIILLWVILFAFVTKSKKIMYFGSAFQSLALISFVEMGWQNPTAYLLQSFQYMMPLTLMSNPSKG